MVLAITLTEAALKTATAVAGAGAHDALITISHEAGYQDRKPATTISRTVEYKYLTAK